jgi:hypothetical protein
MCRNITMLRGLEPPATTEETEAAALQYIRKVGGIQKPTAATEAAIERAVARVAAAAPASADRAADAAPRRGGDATGTRICGHLNPANALPLGDDYACATARVALQPEACK